MANLVVKSTLGVGFGVVFSMLLFRRRAWPVWFGLGFGAGRGYEGCDGGFRRAGGVGGGSEAGGRVKRGV